MGKETFDIDVSVRLPLHADSLCIGSHKTGQRAVETLIDLLGYAIHDDPYYSSISRMDFDSVEQEKRLSLRIKFETSHNGFIIIRGSTTSKLSPLGLIWWLSDCHGMKFEEAIAHYLFVAPEAMKRFKAR